MCMCACVDVFGGGRIVGEEERGTGEGKEERRERKGERRERKGERREEKVEERGEEKLIRVGILEQEVLCRKVLYKIHHVGNGPNPMMLYVKVSGI